MKIGKEKMEEKNQLIHNVSKTALAQGTGATVSKAFGKLMSLIGIPEAIILSPLVRGATIGITSVHEKPLTFAFKF